MEILSIGLVIMFLLGIVYALTLPKMMARIEAEEAKPLSMNQAIIASSILAWSRRNRERRKIVWRHGKPFYLAYLGIQLVMLAWAAVFFFFVLLRSIYASV